LGDPAWASIATTIAAATIQALFISFTSVR
jgi:hypothetical protein